MNVAHNAPRYVLPPAGTWIERFWVKVDKTEECWLWTASRSSDGYGQVTINPYGWWSAHRVSYLLLVGPIPEGLHLDHLCRVRHCVNPAHLEPVTCRENVLRGRARAAQQARQTHCKRGHPLSGDNLYLFRNGKSISRGCRACRQAVQQQRPRRHRGKAV